MKSLSSSCPNVLRIIVHEPLVRSSSKIAIPGCKYKIDRSLPQIGIVIAKQRLSDLLGVVRSQRGKGEHTPPSCVFIRIVKRSPE